MKLFIASDIHGSAHYTKLMLELYKETKAERLLLLGDILYHGPRNDLPAEYNPKLVIEMLNNIKDEILCVRGNCEAEVDQMVLGFPCLADYCLIELDKHTVFATHGHNYNLNSLPPLKRGDILLHGHTHVSRFEHFGNDNIYINPGSVYIPKENTKHSVMLYENNKFSLVDIESKEIIEEYTL